LFVIEIGADSERLRKEKRLVGRLMCPGCGEIYNEYSRVPKKDQVCDICGRGLVHRSDDREDLILERFRTYREETYPLVQFYQTLGVYHQVNGMQPIQEVTKNILSIVNCRGSKPGA
jgi:adenylate kinase